MTIGTAIKKRPAIVPERKRIETVAMGKYLITVLFPSGCVHTTKRKNAIKREIGICAYILFVL
jgi:hypothetical protein